MTDKELFLEQCSGGYQNTKSKVSWKIVQKRVQFQGSVEVQDWYRNFAVIPWPVRIRGIWVWVSLGMLLAWLEIRKRVLAEEPEEAAAYSGGGPVGALFSAHTGRPATVFGCPPFLYKPSLRALQLFDNVRFIDCPFDVVTQIIPWGRRGDRVYTLDQRHVEKPDWMGWPLWITGHSTHEYLERLP